MKLEMITIKKNALASKRAMTAAQKIAQAINVAEASELVKAVQLYNLRSYIKSGEITEFANIVDLAKSLFDIGKAQCYNLLQVAEWVDIRYVVQENEITNKDDFPKVVTRSDYEALTAEQKKYVKEIYTDRFTGSLDKPIMPTALLAIVRFISLDKDGTMNDTARARYSFVSQSAKEGKINGTMTVSEINSYLNSYTGEKKDSKQNSKQNGKQDGKQDSKQNSKQNGKQDGKQNGKTAKSIQLDIEEKTALSIKVELTKVFKDIDYKNEYPQLTALFELITDSFKK